MTHRSIPFDHPDGPARCVRGWLFSLCLATPGAAGFQAHPAGPQHVSEAPSSGAGALVFNRSFGVTRVSCQVCEGEFALTSTSVDEREVDLASQFSGGSTQTGALVVWGTDQFSGPAGGLNISGRFFCSAAGSTVDLGGACGGNAAAAASCVRQGNATFAMRLFSAAPSSLAALLCATTAINATAPACVGCRIVPHPTFGLAVGASTDALGQATVTLAIPNNINLRSFLMQWIGQGGCQGVQLSNAQLVYIDP